jgi:iron complex transport system substrate-binding protein
MRCLHGCHVLALCAVIALSAPAVAAPQRVVSVSLCTDEYVFRLLPRERIAALSFLSADRHPVVSTIADQVRGIALIHASTEEVLSRKPDLVVMYAGTDARLHAHLREAGVDVLDVPWADSLSDIRQITLHLGSVMGAEARAKSLLVKMDRDLAGMAPLRPPVRTLIYEPNGYATADGVTDEILERAGLINAARAMGATRQGTVSVEMVVADPPELLILNNSSQTVHSRADLVLHHPALETLPRNVMIARATLTPLLCPGPWSVAAVPEFAALGLKARALARMSGQP